MSRSLSRAGMTGAFLANGVSFGAWVGALPRLREQAGLNDAQLGLVLLAVAAGAAVAMPPAGAVASRIGSGRVTVLTGLVVAVLLPLPSLAPGWAALLAASVALGMTTGAMDVAMNARAGEVETAWGSPIMSSFHAGWSLGGFLGSLLGSALAAAGFALPVAMASSAALVLLLTLGGLLVRENARPASARGSGFVLPNRAVAAVSALALLAFVSEGTVADWNGVFLRTELAASAARASGGLAAFSGAMVVGRLIGDTIVRRFGPTRVVRFGALLAAFGLVAALIANGPLLAIGALAVVGLGVANIAPLIFSAAGRRGGAPGVALAATLGYGGLMGAPPMIGLLADAAGLRAALALVLFGFAGIMALAPALATTRAATPVG